MTVDACSLARHLAKEFFVPSGLVTDMLSIHQALWHLEDRSRSPAISLGEKGSLKRQIDVANSRRHDLIHAVDSAARSPGPSGDMTDSQTAYQQTIGEFVDTLLILHLRTERLTELVHVRTDTHESDEERLRTCTARCAHAEVVVTQLIAQSRRGVAVLPPGSEAKVYAPSQSAD